MEVIAFAGVLAAALFACAWLRLRASLPVLNGTVRVVGIEQPVRIDRDAAGVPIVHGTNRMDVAFGLGFLHAQERFFQMDLCRRSAAGELAEILGKRFVSTDRAMRIHQFRNRAERIVASLGEEHLRLLTSYTAGVRAGLTALRAPPFEYGLTRTRPIEWRPEDTILIVLNMYCLLQDSRADQDYNLYLLHSALPAAIADFLTPAGSSDWDAPLLGEPSSEARIPGPHILDFRAAAPRRDPHALRGTVPMSGSNAWAVAAASAGTGRAIIANDMHLGFGMPPAFYRATLQVGAGAGARRLSGITLPGFPFLVAGSNGDIAWGLANAAIDAVDLVRLDQAGLPPDACRTHEGVARIQTVREVIRTREGGAEELEIRLTPWGPVSRKTRGGAQFAQLWVAHHTQSVNLEWLALENATSVADALSAANRLGAPTLGIVVADRRGDVGWTLAGPLPRRAVGRGRLPIASSAARAGWDGWVEPHEYPHLTSPRFDRVWSANSRPIAGDEGVRLLGHGCYVLGARALQIRNSLLRTQVADEAAMLRIQLDDRALFLSRWRTLLREVLADADVVSRSRRDEMRAALDHWEGRACVSSVAYPLVQQFRSRVARLALEPFVSMVKGRHGHFDLERATDQLERPLWCLLTERPPHLLPPWFESWRDLLGAALRETLAAMGARAGRSAFTWGDANALVMRHPMSSLIPLLGRLLDAPSAPLNGDVHMPLAQTSRHGPLFRFVISPGHEAAATLQMAGGQAGNPLAPYYRSGHAQWLEGTPAPLLPGPVRYSVTLLPIMKREAGSDSGSNPLMRGHI